MKAEKSFKEIEKDNARVMLSKIDAALILIKNNLLACEIDIGGIRIGIVKNNKIAPALKHTRREIEKYLAGESNEWE